MTGLLCVATGGAFSHRKRITRGISMISFNASHSRRLTFGAMRHLIAGGIGTVFYMAAVSILVEFFHMHPVLSAAISFVLLELYTYAIYRIWVYQSTKGHGYALPRFLVVTITTLSLNAGIMYFAVEAMEWSYVWGVLSATLIVPPTNFLFNFCWAFK